MLSFSDAWKVLQANDPLRLAAATAFFTTFALPAILVIIIQLLRLVFRIQHVGRRLMAALEAQFGRETADAVTHTLRAFRSLTQNWIISIAGFLFLLFVATTLFKIIKGSINQLWQVKSVKKESFRQIMRSRLRGVLVIIFAGLLFVLDIIAEAAKGFLGKYIEVYVPAMSFYYNSALSYLIQVLVVTVWFYIVFFFIPDARPRFKPGIVGALVTGILFTAGKLLLRILLNYSSINTIYGASASTVLLLLFMFYSSMIFYFGAAFTHAWSARRGMPVVPLPNAGYYEVTTATADSNMLKES